MGKIERSLDKAIEDVYYVNGLKYSLLIMSQIYEKKTGIAKFFLVELVDFKGSASWHANDEISKQQGL